MRISDTRLQNFRRVLAEKKLRLTDVADRLGKAPAQVSSFGGKNPKKGIGDQIARELEWALGLNIGYLDMPYGPGELSDVTVLTLTGRKIPVVGSATAARLCETNQTLETNEAEEWICAPGPVGPRAFILRMDGVSMEPKITQGDKVVIDPSLEASSGDFVAVKKSTHNRVLLKQLKKEGDELYLHALNPDWPERIVRMNAEWEICGRALWNISEL